MAFSAITLFAFLASFAYLPQLPTSQEQEQALSEQQETGNPQEGQTPIPVVIEGSITVVDQPTATEEERYIDQVRRENRLFFAAFFAASAALGAWFANRRQAKAAEEEIRILNDRISEERGEAVAQLTEIRREAESAEKQLRLTVRPKLVVRNVVLPLHLETLDGTLDVANVGAGVATVIKAHAEIHIRPTGDLPDLPNVHDYSQPASVKLPENTQIHPGADRRLSIPSFTLPADDHQAFQTIRNMQKASGGTAEGNPLETIYIVGYVCYTDTSDIRRSTTFCRRYDKYKRRYLLDSDSDYEYAN